MTSFYKHPLVEPLLDFDGQPFPKQELAQLIAAKDEVTPLLIEVLEDYWREPDMYGGFGGTTIHLIAVAVLAQFREVSVWPILSEMFKVKDENQDLRYDFFYEMNIDDISRVIASFARTNITDLKNIAFDNDINHNIRSSCLLALMSCYFEGDFSRKDLIDFIRLSFEEFRKDDGCEEQDLFWFDLIAICSNIHAFELADEIQRAAPAETVGEELLEIELESMRNYDESSYQKWLEDFDFERTEFGYIHNSVEILEQWLEEDSDNLLYIDEDLDSIFEKNCDEDQVMVRSNFDLRDTEPYVRELPKVGRNDPCPCKSGKKFKKCCGK